MEYGIKILKQAIKDLDEMNIEEYLDLWNDLENFLSEFDSFRVLDLDTHILINEVCNMEKILIPIDRDTIRRNDFNEDCEKKDNYYKLFYNRINIESEYYERNKTKSD